jgi:hypothetical protein
LCVSIFAARLLSSAESESDRPSDKHVDDEMKSWSSVISREEFVAIKEFANDSEINALAHIGRSGATIFAFGPEKRDGRVVRTKFIEIAKVAGTNPISADIKIINSFYLKAVKTNTNTVLKVMGNEKKVVALDPSFVQTAETVVEKVLLNQFESSGSFSMPEVKLDELTSVERGREPKVIIVTFLSLSTEYQCFFRLEGTDRLIFLYHISFAH